MKVIILKDIKTLGKADNIIDVADGYARNVLIPKGFVEQATPEAINRMNNRIAKIRHEYECSKEAATRTVEKLNNIEELSIRVECSDTGKMFGAVTSKDISECLSALDIDVDKKCIIISKPIKTLGKYEVKVNLFSDISCNIVVHVISNK